MTNNLVGDVYLKIIEDVCTASLNDFEESGVNQSTLGELKSEWQTKLSQRGVAQMPWDPKPAPPVQQSASNGSNPSSATASGIPQPPSYPAYDPNQANNSHAATPIKTEPGTEGQVNGVANGNYPPNGIPAQGGIVRAQQLVQQYGTATTASINAMQQRSGLALPGQQTKPQGIQLPPQALTPAQQQQYLAQQHAAIQRQQQMQQHPMQQQGQVRVKVETESPQTSQASPDQKPPPNLVYSQNDGADEALEEWQAMLAQRRAISTEQRQHADRMMHSQVLKMMSDFQVGLLLSDDDTPSKPKVKKSRAKKGISALATVPSTQFPAPTGTMPPQLDGDVDDDDDGKTDNKDDEDDENAINSDLDDPDDDDPAAMGDDEDEAGDQILCTYDKVQRVKNKWKCTLKDGVMIVGGREWVFHKGMGEFEW